MNGRRCRRIVAAGRVNITYEIYPQQGVAMTGTGRQAAYIELT